MKTLRLAILATLACHPGMSGAVHVSPNGHGQVLIYPYYTARGGFNTLITVINSQDNTKAVKVRFLEGKNSREVLDFNLFMSPNDIWTGAVVATANGARLITNDNSCVLPNDLFTETRTDGQGLAPNEFKNAQYTGAMTDSTEFSLLDRTREGYFEVIEMAVIDTTTSSIGASVAGYIRQNNAGIPANCAALNSFEPTPGNTNLFRFPNVGAQLMVPPQGGLTGRASLIRADNGSNFTFSPTALDAWSNAINYTVSGNVGPSLADASPPTSLVLTPEGLILSHWVTGRDAVSASLMRYTVRNEFIRDAGTISQTDWIVTYPTKRLHVDAGTGAAQPPFVNNFPNSVVGSCDAYSAAVFNRETSGRQIPIPPDIRLAGTQVCWSANVVPFASSSLAAATDTNPLIASLQMFVNDATSIASQSTTPALRGTQGPNGYFSMQFDANVASLTPISATLTPISGTPRSVTGRTYGLPIIGFMMHNYQNTGVQSRYGGVIEHKYTSRIE